jgi:hypothetical protein
VLETLSSLNTGKLSGAHSPNSRVLAEDGSTVPSRLLISQSCFSAIAFLTKILVCWAKKCSKVTILRNEFGLVGLSQWDDHLLFFQFPFIFLYFGNTGVSMQVLYLLSHTPVLYALLHFSGRISSLLPQAGFRPWSSLILELHACVCMHSCTH